MVGMISDDFVQQVALIEEVDAEWKGRLSGKPSGPAPIE